MGVIFGGAERGGAVDGQVRLPEEVRAQQCTHDKCQECGTSANCFRCDHGGKSNRWGPLSILSVKPGLPFTSYRASAYAKCKTGHKTKLSVMIRAMHNGELKVFVDGIYKETLKKVGGAGRREHIEQWTDTHLGDGAFQVSVEFFPTNRAEKSSVVMTVEIEHVRPEFEQCLDHKACLAAMGNMNNKASYALRNMNEYQLSCLRRATLPSFDGKMGPTCEAWRSCVEKNPALAKSLQTSLSAANPRKPQVEDASVTRATRDQDECLDPSIADIEALECDCMVTLQKKCGDDEECFKSQYCADNRVCQEWKVSNGCSKLLSQLESNSSGAPMALAAERRSLQTEISSSANILTDNLESALQGKCSQ